MRRLGFLFVSRLGRPRVTDLKIGHYIKRRGLGEEARRRDEGAVTAQGVAVKFNEVGGAGGVGIRGGCSCADAECFDQ